MVLNPWANQGPLAGLLITGPGGAALGAPSRTGSDRPIRRGSFDLWVIEPVPGEDGPFAH